MNITHETNQLEVLSCNFRSKNTPPTKERKFYFSSDYDFISTILTFLYKLTRKICKYYDTTEFKKCDYGLCQYYFNLTGCVGYCKYTKTVIKN